MKKLYGLLLLTLIGIMSLLVNVTPVKADTYQENWAKLPHEVRNTLTNDGWIIREECNLSQKFGFTRKIMALTSYQEYIIYLEPRKKDNALLHEVGHALEEHYFELLGYYPSDTPEFDAIRKSEYNAMIKVFPTNKYNYNTSEEYFAEAFQNVILDSDTMSNICPMTYNFINSLIKGLDK